MGSNLPNGSAPAAPASPHTKKDFVHLPREVQEQIVKLVSINDLVSLALVSRDFNELASAQLYRQFHIYFDDEDGPEPEPYDDALAFALDSMVTSERRYARHLKDLNFDSPNGGKKGEREYRHFLYSTSCGKFMNTLLLLAIRQAEALETFHWNVRVEINRPMFAALHRLPKLKNLHIRMQRGASLYKPLRPIPSSTSPPPVEIYSFPAVKLSPPPPPPPYQYSSKYSPPPPRFTPLPKEGAGKEPPTFSAFKNLRHLAVLDIDALEYIQELAECVKGSSTTLRKLKLSLSEELALKARKPPLADSDDSDQELDEFGVAPLPPTQEGWSQEKENNAKKELSAQETVLGKVFGLEKLPDEDPDDVKVNVVSLKTDDELSKMFIKNLKAITEKLLEATQGTHPPKDKLRSQKEALMNIEKAAAKYIGTQSKESVLGGPSGSKKTAKKALALLPNGDISKKDDEVKSEGSGFKTPDTDSVPSPTQSEKGKSKVVEPTVNGTDALNDEASDEPGLFDQPEPKSKKDNTKLDPDDVAPEDIDIDHPDIDEADEVEDQEIDEQLEKRTTEVAKMAEELTETIKKDLVKAPPDEFVMSGGLHLKDGVIDDPSVSEDDVVKERTPSVSSKGKASKRPLSTEDAIRDYVRSTRKLALDELSLYLIPVKASILSKAIDLTNLERITLLNVGPQEAFWALMRKEQSIQPLRLRCIFTDNVTNTFLSFVNSLDKVKEIFMLERNSEKPDVESLAPKTTVVIEDIRKMVLKKHMKTLTRLMIKNEHEHEYSWDLNGKAVQLITRRGKRLVELSAGIDLRSYHLLLQNISTLTSLRALHLLRIRLRDTCPSVVAELRQVVGDTIAHNPHMKLEYIAYEGIIERLERREEQEKKRRKEAKANQREVDRVVQERKKSKALAAKPDVANSGGNEGSVVEATNGILANGVGVAAAEVDKETDSESDSDDDYRPALKIGVKDMRFYHADGIRIFRKDVRAGKL